MPGSHHGSWAASSDVTFSQSYRSWTVIGSCQPDRPAVWLITWRIAISPLPPAPNSGHTLATGAYRSSSPWSASSRQHSADRVFVVDQTLMIVSRSHGTSVAESVVTVPPQRSTTSSPSSVIASDAPTSLGSLPSAKLAANASRIAPNRSSHVPWISMRRPYPSP